MKRIPILLSAFLFLVCTCSTAQVLKIVVNETIQPITEEYIDRAIAEADRQKDQAVLIELNTPGGLVESTR
ncbi:MAG: nodulation protein NfeD, partial [Acidobacteriaceae bacterium]|nr:nodulation protein NfeD [Acidobacteriaceae bacterium]